MCLPIDHGYPPARMMSLSKKDKRIVGILHFSFLTPDLKAPSQALTDSVGTFDSLIGHSNNLARLHLQSLVKRSGESDIKRALSSAISDWFGHSLAPSMMASSEPRAEIAPGFCLKYAKAEGGMAFQDDIVQKALVELYGESGIGDTASSISKADFALLAASCDCNASPGAPSRSSPTAAHDSTPSPGTIPAPPYFCVPTLIIDVKVTEPWRQFFRLICCTLQAYQLTGCRLGLALHRTSFSRIVIVDEITVLVETNSAHWLGTTYSMAEFAALGSQLRAAQLYHHDLGSATMTALGTSVAVNGTAYGVLEDLIKVAIDLLRVMPLIGGPTWAGTARQKEQITRTLLDACDRANSGPGYVTEPMSAGVGEWVEQEEHGGVGLEAKGGTSARDSPRETKAEYSGSAASRDEHYHEPSQRKESEIKDDRGPISMIDSYRVLLHIGVRLTIVDSTTMSRVVSAMAPCGRRA